MLENVRCSLSLHVELENVNDVLFFNKTLNGSLVVRKYSCLR